MSDLLYKIALSFISSVGPITAKQIVSYCGGPKAVFKEKASLLVKIPKIGPKTAKEILDKNVLIKAEKELEFIQKNNISTYFYLDEAYPSRLKPYNDSPIVLFFQGKVDLNHRRCIGVVGSRRPTEQGSHICERIISELKDFDPLIISGLAYGIDAISHRKAFNESIPTLGVMGSGIDITYPASHRELRKKMLTNGGVLTEFPSGTTPEREHFPMRNRIIAAMSDALLVVESGRKGGSMITAHFAFSYNKDVFAVPGKPGDTMSAGPNFLIKSNVASLAESGEDIAYKMLWEKDKEKQAKQLQLFNDLLPGEKKLIDIINSFENKFPSIDQIHYESGLNMSQLSSLILELECKNIIRAYPGARYRVVSR